MSEWIFLKDAARQRGITQGYESNERMNARADHLLYRCLPHPRSGRRMFAVRLDQYLDHVAKLGKLTPLWERYIRAAAITVADPS